MTVYRITPVRKANSPRDCWEVRDHSGRVVIGPANLLDCQRGRTQLIERERRGEYDFSFLAPATG